MTKVQPPKTIKVGQRIYKVKVTDESNDLNLYGNYGYTNKIFDIIAIAANISLSQKRSTLFHEVMHAVSIVFGNPHAKVEEKKEDEEYKEYEERWLHYFIELMDENLLMVLRENPGLVEFLTKD